MRCGHCWKRHQCCTGTIAKSLKKVYIRCEYINCFYVLVLQRTCCHLFNSINLCINACRVVTAENSERDCVCVCCPMGVEAYVLRTVNQYLWMPWGIWLFFYSKLMYVKRHVLPGRELESYSFHIFSAELWFDWSLQLVMAGVAAHEPISAFPFTHRSTSRYEMS